MANNTKRNAKGGGTIRKRSDGRWEARYTLGIDPKTGKQIQKSVYGKTQKEVRQKLTAITAEIDDGTYMEPCRMTLDEWLDIWLRDYLTGVKPSTAYLYQRQAKLYIRPALGSVRLDRLEPHTIQRFYNSLHEERDGKPSLSAKSIKNIHGILHKALQQAVLLNYLRTNPTNACILPKIIKKEIHPMDDRDTALFLEAIKGCRYELLLKVDLFTGLREGELLGLMWDCVDFEKGTVTIIVQTVGATTEKLSHMKEGDSLQDFVGPLGKATETEGKKKVCVVGGGVGCAIAYPVLKKFHDCGAEVHAVIGFKNKDLVILEDEFRAASSVLKVCTDDGSYGQKGVVTEALKELIDAGNQYDEVFAIGPMVMMKFVSKTTEPYGIPTTVSMSPIMIDGTGMCGGCRLSVGGEMKFACVDGPDFDGHKVDWDLAVKRNQMYRDFEAHKYEETCNLFKKEAE